MACQAGATIRMRIFGIWQRRPRQPAVAGGVVAIDSIEGELELITCSCEPARDPLSVVLASTVLVRPKLKTPPTPVPARAAVPNRVTTETIAPSTTPVKNDLSELTPEQAEGLRRSLACFRQRRRTRSNRECATEILGQLVRAPRELRRR